jgi:hypothetical protein
MPESVAEVMNKVRREFVSLGVCGPNVHGPISQKLDMRRLDAERLVRFTLAHPIIFAASYTDIHSIKYVI